MSDDQATHRPLRAEPAFGPAVPLWRLVPTCAGDGRNLADFMMLIPGLGSRPVACRDQVARAVREVCESYGEQVAFADINYALNVLWVSVAAEPGLPGRVAQSIRGRVPEALLVGGHLAAVAPPVAAERLRPSLRRLLCGLSRRAGRLLGGPAG